jgi:ribonucleotide reductase beta subunit family protein with ferritin-like domain
MTTEEKIKEELCDMLSHSIGSYEIQEADFNHALNGCVKFCASEIREAQIKVYKELMAKGHKWMDDCDNKDPESNIKCLAFEQYVDYLNDLIMVEEGKDKV